MITRAKRITFLGFDVGDWLILIIGIALVSLLLCAGLRTQRARGEPQIAGGGPIVLRRRYGRPPSKRDWNFVGLDGIRIPLERVESCSVP